MSKWRNTVVTVFTLVVTQGIFFGAVDAASPVPVVTKRFSTIAIYPQLSAPATVMSLNDAPLSAEVNARVEDITVRVGEQVNKDDVLVRLDCQDYALAHREAKARLESLKARLSFARKRLKRARALTERRTISEEVVDERASDAATIRADQEAQMVLVASAEHQMGKCTIRSPFDAVVTERIAAVGQYANVGTSLLRVQELGHIEVSAQVFSLDSGKLSTARRLVFEHNGKHYPVHVRSIVPVINSRTRNQEVRLNFDEETALSGTAGKLLWQDSVPHAPAEIIVRRKGIHGLFVERQGVAHFIPLPDAQPGRPAEVGLPNDIHIIVEGHYGLTDKAPVVVKIAEDG